MLDTVNAIQANMNQGLYSCGVFIDLKKAFDTVDHNILLDKLNFYGFRGLINQWFSSYLNDRTQTTQIADHIWNKASISFGVPQGSFLGPLLFYYLLMISTSALLNLNSIFARMIPIYFLLKKIWKLLKQ